MSKDCLEKGLPPLAELLGDQTGLGLWLSRVVLNEFLVSWWGQRTQKTSPPGAPGHRSFPSLARACPRGQAHVCAGPGCRQTALERRAKARQKGLLPLPHSFLFQRQQDLTTNSQKTITKAWERICMQLVRRPHHLLQTWCRWGETCATEIPGF